MRERIDVTIDSREPDDLVADFESHMDVDDVNQVEMPTGDILPGGVLIERKTPQDLVSSIKDNRLFQQAKELSAEPHSFILLEGELDDFRNLTHTDIPPNAVRGSIASVMVRTGVPVVPCGGRLDLVDLAIRLGRKSVEEESIAFNQEAFETDGEVNPTIQMYASIPGVGPTRARTLYETFPAPLSLAEATPEAIGRLEGFGNKTAQNVYEAMRGQIE